MKLNRLALTTVVLFAPATLVSSLVIQSAQAERPQSACEQGVKGPCKDKKEPFVVPRHGSPTVNCISPYFTTASGALCMTGNQPATSYANAEANCRALRGRVADYGDWRARINAGGASPTVGSWLGPITADNVALFTNLSNVGDFDGETSRFDSRTYVCARDRS